MSKQSKIVVFDLDETLGNFVELGMFCDALEKLQQRKLNDNDFFNILDIFSEFLRPNILKILKFLLEKKRKGKCSKIMIYTNNQGPQSWAKKISSYFEYKLGNLVFDQIIAAFKVKGKIVEICRTSHDKSVDDLLNCTKIPPSTQICFLDDQYHPLMEHNNVFYINVKPYIYNIKFKEMAERYFDKIGIDMNKEEFIRYIYSYMNEYNFTVIDKGEKEKKVDEIISKKIILHLEEFFNNNTNKTRRKRNKRNLTRRKYIN